MIETTEINDSADVDEGAALLTVEELVKTFSGEKKRRRRRSGTGAAPKPAQASAEDNRVAPLDGVSFDVRPGELFTLLGPSGCGKTTTLRSIAGLERPDGGTISVDGEPLFDAASRLAVPANSRKLGMVFQSYAIWPHMTVFKNVAFPLEVLPRRGRPSRAVTE